MHSGARSIRRPATIATAGHIDHGKTALVKALTGDDTDRLSEERRRGMSIELGFAELSLPSGNRVSIVDVPGHEDLIRTMAAGCSGIDLFVLVVAADDGVMPQTLEHLAVLRAFGKEAGVVALTKVDRATADQRGEVLAAIKKLVPEAAVVEVAPPIGLGVSDLAAAVEEAIQRLLAVEAEREDEVAWARQPLLHIDRVFSMPGAGLVVTGTLASGTFTAGQSVRLLPNEVDARIRGMQSHGRQVDEAEAVQRVALNLSGVRKRRPSPGDSVVADPSPLAGSFRLDVKFDVEGLDEVPDLPGEMQVHHGTRQLSARVVEIAHPYAQLRLREPVVAQAGDRLVVRDGPRRRILGGAKVIDARPERAGTGAAARIRLLAEASPEEVLNAAFGENPGLATDPEAWAQHPAVAPALHRFPRSRWQAAAQQVLQKPVVKVADGGARSSSPKIDRQALGAAKAWLSSRGNPWRAVELADQLGTSEQLAKLLLDALSRERTVGRLDRNLYLSAAAIEKSLVRLEELALEGLPMDIPTVRDALEFSRSEAAALLSFLDRERITIRQGGSRRFRSRESEPRPRWPA